MSGMKVVVLLVSMLMLVGCGISQPAKRSTHPVVVKSDDVLFDQAPLDANNFITCDIEASSGELLFTLSSVTDGITSQDRIDVEAPVYKLDSEVDTGLLDTFEKRVVDALKSCAATSPTASELLIRLNMDSQGSMDLRTAHMTTFYDAVTEHNKLRSNPLRVLMEIPTFEKSE